MGRDEEVAALETAFVDALTGRCRAVLVSGAPGVGKTALVDELRRVVTARDGWFVAGKFDQYRRDLESDAVNQVFRALGGLLLAEPEDELAVICQRILDAVGANAGLLTAAAPEFATLLGVASEPGDPLTADVRAQRTAVQVLRAIASGERPVAVFLDDLQWAGRTPVGVVDLVLSEEPIEGLLLVGAYRDDEVDATGALAAPLSRWLDRGAAQHLRLGNLPMPSLVELVAEMLHREPLAVAGLVEAVIPHTSGNPYETVELLNSLRREGGLTPTAEGWRWDPTAVRAHLGRSEVTGMSAARVEGLSEPARRLVEVMACLGGRAEQSALRVATGESAAVMDNALESVLDEGLLVMEPGPHKAVRFHHDRTRDLILGGLDSHRKRARCSWRWRADWLRCPSCSRSPPSSTCRWSTRSTMRRSGA